MIFPFASSVLRPSLLIAICCFTSNWLNAQEFQPSSWQQIFPNGSRHHETRLKEAVDGDTANHNATAERLDTTQTRHPPTSFHFSDHPVETSSETALLNTLRPQREDKTDQAQSSASEKSATRRRLTVEGMLSSLPPAESLLSRADVGDAAGPADPISPPVHDLGQPTLASFKSITWTSPAFFHAPLYFEQPNLERYGQGVRPILQPAVSAAHFFGSIPLAPYRALKRPPHSLTSTLGHGRPGNCVPVQRNHSLISDFHIK